jgi:hypothetical protein
MIQQSIRGIVFSPMYDKLTPGVTVVVLCCADDGDGLMREKLR